jgi:hypothetical protein
MSEEKSILETLVDGQYVTINGERRMVRPWSIGTIEQMLPILSTAMQLMQKQKLLPLKETQFDDLMKALSTEPGTVLQNAGPYLPLLISTISITLDISEEDTRQLAAGDAIGLALLIVKQNVSYLKNFCGPQLQVIVKMLQG